MLLGKLDPVEFLILVSVFLILLTVTVCVTIVCTYFLLNAEDYRYYSIPSFPLISAATIICFPQSKCQVRQKIPCKAKNIFTGGNGLPSFRLALLPATSISTPSTISSSKPKCMDSSKPHSTLATWASSAWALACCAARFVNLQRSIHTNYHIHPDWIPWDEHFCEEDLCDSQDRLEGEGQYFTVCSSFRLLSILLGLPTDCNTDDTCCCRRKIPKFSHNMLTVQ